MDTRVPPVNVVELLCLDEAAIGARRLPSTRLRPTAELGVRPRGLVQPLVLTPDGRAHAGRACTQVSARSAHAARMQHVRSAYAVQMSACRCRADAVCGS